MENYYNKFNFQFVFNQIDLLKIEQHKNESKIVELNNVIEYLLACYKALEEAKQSHKSDLNKKTKQSKNIEKEHVMKKCRYFNAGYCRSKSSCTFLHPTTLCKLKDCRDKECSGRHLKNCKNWLKNECKFGNSCEYKHDADKKHTKTQTNNTKTKISLDNSSSKEVEDAPHETNEEIEAILKVNDLENDCNVDSKETDRPVDDIIEKYENIGDDNDSAVSLDTNKIASFKFACDKCNFKSQGKRSLNKHMKEVHIVYHKCDKCEHNATSDHYLKLHVKSHHKDVESEISKKRKITNDDLPSRKKTK